MDTPTSENYMERSPMENTQGMIERLAKLANSIKKNSSVFIEHFFMMLGVSLAVLVALKLLTWMF